MKKNWLESLLIAAIIGVLLLVVFVVMPAQQAEDQAEIARDMNTRGITVLGIERTTFDNGPFILADRRHSRVYRIETDSGVYYAKFGPFGTQEIEPWGH